MTFKPHGMQVWLEHRTRDDGLVHAYITLGVDQTRTAGVSLLGICSVSVLAHGDCRVLLVPVIASQRSERPYCALERRKIVAGDVRLAASP